MPIVKFNQGTMPQTEEEFRQMEICSFAMTMFLIIQI